MRRSRQIRPRSRPSAPSPAAAAPHAVFNFVGIQATADLAAKLVGPGSDIVMIGLGPGAIPVSVNSLPGGTSVRAPVWGTRPELMEVLDLARSGAIKVETERFSLEERPQGV